MEVDTDMVEEKLEEEAGKVKQENKEDKEDKEHNNLLPRQ